MSGHRFALATAFALAALFFGWSAPAALPATLEVGDSADYTFGKPLANGMGITSLAELRGKPVLVEFWGYR